MSERRHLFAMLLTVGLAGPAAAGPSITLSWDGYPGPTDRSRHAGSIATVVVTAVGFERPVKGIDVRLRVTSGFGALPDAWQYDAAGCAAGGFSTPETAAGPALPLLTGANQIQLSRARYENGSGSFLYANVHDLTTVDPATRYTVGKFEFNHDAAFDGAGTRADSCGCIEQPLCLQLTNATWVDDQGNELPFALSQWFLSWEDPNNTIHCPYGCDLCSEEPPTPPNPCLDAPTPTVSRSWGSLKGSYR
jgi:hypothetical protein